MSVIVNILLALFIPVCILLVLVVLLQAGRGGGLSSAFGGTGMQPFLGARGTADFLSKVTIYLAISFFTLALVLSITYGPSRMVKLKGGEPAQVTEESQAGDITTETQKAEQGSAQPTSSSATTNKSSQPTQPAKK